MSTGPRRPSSGSLKRRIMKSVVAAFNSSIQFNKHNFWIDPKNKNQYFVGVQYYEEDIKSIETLLDIPITTDRPDKPTQTIPPADASSRSTRSAWPTEVTHYNIQPTIEVTHGRLRPRPGARLGRRHPRCLDKFGILESTREMVAL